jgi:cytochrome c-type biogenesis protein CcmE
MTPSRKKRLALVILIVIGVSAAASLMLLAFQSNVQLFVTPTDIANGKAPSGRVFRLGGLVVKGSVRREPDSLAVHFDLTDMTHTITVAYEGILPDLFREGQGIVTQGSVDEKGVFNAIEVLAKHDENYMSPELEAALKKANVDVEPIKKGTP